MKGVGILVGTVIILSFTANVDGLVSITVSTALNSTGGTANPDSAALLTLSGTIPPGTVGDTETADSIDDDYITVENTGDVYIDIAADADDVLFPESTAYFPDNDQAFVKHNEDSTIKSYYASYGSDLTNYTELNLTTAAQNTLICHGLPWQASYDFIKVHLKLDVPRDAVQGAHGIVVTIYAAEDITGANDAA
jgi:hypothetical protein